ncbi:MAG TPA: hypothetical protein VNO31_35535 [Umezawaea sp.]|nr:hypothetical protein [Umezawaea sp.]
MANGVFNISKGLWRYYLSLPATNDALVVVLLKGAGLVADSVLADYDDLAALLAGASDEADFTSYARKTITTGITITVDDTNDRVDGDIDDQVWSPAGGAANNTLGKLITCYDSDTTGGTDSGLIPVTYHDFVATTDGNPLTAQVATAGLVRAA